MKLLHMADLHIGKSVNGFSMLEDQRHVLNEILKIIGDERPDAVIIAGDIYDKPAPSAEAVALFDDFLSSVGTETFIISGNHDSAERIAFGRRLMSSAGIHISPVYQGKIEPIIFRNGSEEAGFYLIPFLKPGIVRTRLKHEDIFSYADAMRAVIGGLELPSERINIAVAHQFISGSEKSGSEEVSVGGLDDVPWDIFKDFDYAALGHIHRAQKIGRENIRYSGSPLKYSFSEAGHVKSVTVAELGDRGEAEIKTIPLKPLHDMRIISGSYDEITLRRNYIGSNTEDYVRIILTDENEVPDAIGKLRSIYPNIMELVYDNSRTKESLLPVGINDIELKTPSELFGDFYAAQNNSELSREQKKFVDKIIESIWEGEQ